MLVHRKSCYLLSGSSHVMPANTVNASPQQENILRTCVACRLAVLTGHDYAQPCQPNFCEVWDFLNRSCKLRFQVSKSCRIGCCSPDGSLLCLRNCGSLADGLCMHSAELYDALQGIRVMSISCPWELIAVSWTPLGHAIVCQSTHTVQIVTSV